ARDELAAARDRLADLVREAGCGSSDDLPAVEVCAGRRLAAEEELRAVEARLRSHSAGAPVEAFVAEAGNSDADALAGEIEVKDRALAGLLEERKTLDQAIGREEQALAQMEETAREARAQRAAGEAQALLARVESETGRFLRLRLASAVLRAAIERYRQRAQGPLLRRASAFFQRLTLGSFAALDTDFDDAGDPLLVGVRPDGARVGVKGLSEGTRDQLYLALKLASLDHYLDHHEPLPFVADDLLVNFDDDRSRAALAILADLSHRTQILFFTHHRHLVELAEATIPPDVLFTHELQPAFVGAGARASANGWHP